MELALAPSTVTSFKSVSKAGKKRHQARRFVDGKVRHVWTSADKVECAKILALYKLFPCELQSQFKERGATKEDVLAETEKWMSEAATLEALVPQVPVPLCGEQRAREPAATQDAKRVVGPGREPLSPVKNL